MAPEFPDWWGWELEFSPHLLKRMVDRRFTEVDLRLMIDAATGYHESYEAGRWTIECRLAGRAWEVIVEPDLTDEVLVVVTAYPIEW